MIQTITEPISLHGSPLQQLEPTWSASAPVSAKEDDGFEGPGVGWSTVAPAPALRDTPRPPVAPSDPEIAAAVDCADGGAPRFPLDCSSRRLALFGEAIAVQRQYCVRAARDQTGSGSIP